MSVETHPPRDLSPEDAELHPELVREINSISDNPNTLNTEKGAEELPTPELQDNRELSPLASALDRVASFLDKQSSRIRGTSTSVSQNKLDRLHGKALKMYSKMNTDTVNNGDYTDHLVKLSETQADGNIATIEAQQSTGRDLLEKQNRKIDRLELMDEAKDRIHRFGSAALNVTLGLGLQAGDTIGRGINRGTEAVSKKAADVRDSVASFANNRREDVGNLASDIKDKYVETKWRAENAVENKAIRLKQSVKLGVFDTLTTLDNNDPIAALKDKVALKKAEVHDAAFEVSRYRIATVERAKAALTRRVERMKAFKDATGEKLDNTRQAAKRRAQRIGRQVNLTLSAAHDSGELFRERMKQAKEENK